MPLVWVKNFAGHANISTTSEYAHLCDDTNLTTGVFS